MEPEDQATRGTDWQRIAETEEFRALVAAKKRFIGPAVVFFIVFYLALPVLNGFAPDLMNRPVLGPVNVAYLFALSQFFMTWIVAFLYLRRAARFDAMARDVLMRR